MQITTLEYESLLYFTKLYNTLRHCKEFILYFVCNTHGLTYFTSPYLGKYESSLYFTAPHDTIHYYTKSKYTVLKVTKRDTTKI